MRFRFLLPLLLVTACGDNIKPGGGLDPGDPEDWTEVDPDAGVRLPGHDLGQIDPVPLSDDCDDQGDSLCHMHNGHWHCPHTDHFHNGAWHHGH